MHSQRLTVFQQNPALLKVKNPIQSVDFLRDLIRPAAELPEANVCLVGLPLDFGTVLEGGRAGAIRCELHRYHKTYNLEHGINLTGLHIADAGNLALRHSDHVRNLANSNSFK